MNKNAKASFLSKIPRFLFGEIVKKPKVLLDPKYWKKELGDIYGLGRTKKSLQMLRTPGERWAGTKGLASDLLLNKAFAYGLPAYTAAEAFQRGPREGIKGVGSALGQSIGLGLAAPFGLVGFPIIAGLTEKGGKAAGKVWGDILVPKTRKEYLSTMGKSYGNIANILSADPSLQRKLKAGGFALKQLEKVL